jgi:hypothetical protein
MHADWFIEFDTDKLIILTGLSVISTDLSIQTGFHRQQTWNLNLNQFLTNIINFYEFSWNQWDQY